MIPQIRLEHDFELAVPLRSAAQGNHGLCTDECGRRQEVAVSELVSCPTNKHANARAIFSPDKLGTEKSLAQRVERHVVASGVRTNPQCRQAFRVRPALLSTPWRLHIGYAYLSDTTLGISVG